MLVLFVVPQAKEDLTVCS